MALSLSVGASCDWHFDPEPGANCDRTDDKQLQLAQQPKFGQCRPSKGSRVGDARKAGLDRGAPRKFKRGLSREMQQVATRKGQRGGSNRSPKVTSGQPATGVGTNSPLTPLEPGEVSLILNVRPNQAMLHQTGGALPLSGPIQDGCPRWAKNRASCDRWLGSPTHPLVAVISGARDHLRVV